jgi:hypothetical protein
LGACKFWKDRRRDLGLLDANPTFAKGAGMEYQIKAAFYPSSRQGLLLGDFTS